MAHPLQLQSAFVLHYRPYRDTSLLVDFFTQEQGRISAVARGARTPRSPNKGLLQPFTPLLVTWRGRRDLVTLTKVEPNGPAYTLRPRHLRCGFYLNELLLRLIHLADPMPQVFTHYAQAIDGLNQPNAQEEAILRIFERNLLHSLGYQIPLTNDAETGEPIEGEGHYRYEAQRGFIRQGAGCVGQTYHGQSLQALMRGEFETPEVLQDCKRLLRLILSGLLGHKPLRTRELFR